MTVEEAVYYRLANDTTVKRWVANRIYPLVAPQDAAFPFLVYQESGHSRLRAISGSTAVREFRLRIDGYATRYQVAKALRDSIVARLGNYNGTIGNVVIMDINQEDTSDEHLPPVNADEKGIFGAGIDLTIYYTGGD